MTDTLTREQIEAIKHFNEGDHEKLKDEYDWNYVWQHHHGDGNVSPSTVSALCDLALIGLAVQPRPIEDAPKDGNDILVFDSNGHALVMRWSADQKMWGHIGGFRIEGAFWTFIPLSALPKPKATP